MLDRRIEFVKGVGPKMSDKFNKIGIGTVRDLIFYFPRRYNDYTQITKISDLQHSAFSSQHSVDRITIKGTILGIDNKKTTKRRFTVTEAVIEDGTGTLKVVWFNQPFLKKMLLPGRELILNGKITYNSFSHEWVMESPERADRPKIVPVYGETEGMRSGYISAIVAREMFNVEEVEEWLPLQHTAFSSQHSELMPIREAILNIHQPENSEKLVEAQRRLAFDELFMISLQSNITKELLKKEQAPAFSIQQSAYRGFIEGLPFKLTGDQEKAVEAILKDLAKGEPMNRLLNGDVGSGKTVVAAIAAFAAVKAGYRVAVMCPTSILAGQHYETFCKMFEASGISVGLVTSDRQESLKTNNQGTITKEISNSKSQKSKKLDTKYEILNSDIVIGTQALIQKDIVLENLGLVIVDEQHRFGVAQRAALQKLSVCNGVISTPQELGVEKSSANQKISRQARDDNKKSPPIKERQEVVELNADYCMPNAGLKPHFLSMTATPIPRTLQLALFGDLDVSIIKEKPANRKEIKTRFVEPVNRDKSYQFIREHIKHGRQIFVICPLIEESAKSEELNADCCMLDADNDRKSVKSEYEKLQKIFPEFKIGMLHGKMKPKEKDAIMAEFVANRLNILVSTSVVEVGVDVPNATVMMIEDADRFGLAQLHQFRGRVGRAEHQSFCLLFSSTNIPKACHRLESMEVTSDGFKLAEIDLETRGPGAIFGTMQSGQLDLRMASLSDHILISQASEAAKAIAQEDPELEKYPRLKEKVAEYLNHKHLE